MDRVNQVNPFSKRESYSKAHVVTYKIFTILTWLLSVLVTVYYSIDCPREGAYAHKTIWELNDLHPSGFTLNHIIASIYWIVLFIFQLGYIGQLFSNNLEHTNAACAVGSHFILNNLFHVAFVVLFMRSYFGWAELILVLNFVNLSSLHFRHNAYTRFIHAPAVSGPLSWTFVAIYWNGAIMVPHPDTLVAKIFANVFVWSILVYGGFFLVVYLDYTMAFWLSILAAALGVAQFQQEIVALQWIFAFTIMAVLFVAGILVAVPTWLGRELNFGRRQPVSDQERAPLLDENTTS